MALPTLVAVCDRHSISELLLSLRPPCCKMCWWWVKIRAESASWLSDNTFVSEEGDLRFKLRVDLIRRSVPNDSPPLRHFETSCVARRSNDAELGSASSLHSSAYYSEYIMKNFDWFGNNSKVIDQSKVKIECYKNHEELTSFFCDSNRTFSAWIYFDGRKDHTTVSVKIKPMASYSNSHLRRTHSTSSWTRLYLFYLRCSQNGSYIESTGKNHLKHWHQNQ